MDVTTDSGPPPAPAAPPTDESVIVAGTGQHVWLALVTVMSAAALAVAIVALIVAGYGDGDGSGGTATPPPGDAPSALTVAASEFAFDPAAGRVAAGTVDITLDDVGSAQHEYVVLSETIDREDQLDDSIVLGRTPIADAGTSVTATMNLEPGTYQVICAIPGHFTAGMEGTLEVVGG